MLHSGALHSVRHSGAVNSVGHRRAQKKIGLKKEEPNCFWFRKALQTFSYRCRHCFFEASNNYHESLFTFAPSSFSSHTGTLRALAPFNTVTFCVCVCVFAAGAFNKLKWLLAWPLCLLLFFTVPNCSTPRWESWFMLSFVFSTLWIAAFSYVMVWMVRDMLVGELHYEIINQIKAIYKNTDIERDKWKETTNIIKISFILKQ